MEEIIATDWDYNYIKSISQTYVKPIDICGVVIKKVTKTDEILEIIK